MTKKKQEKRPRQPSKRQLARWEQDKRRQRIVFGLVVFVVIAVLSLIGGGFYTTTYRPLHQKVLIVNGTRFDMAYYVDRLKYYGKDQDPSALTDVATQVTDLIQRDELIRQGALALGIEITDDEVDEVMAKAKSPLGKEYREQVRLELLMERLRSEYFDNTVPKTATQRQIMAMFLESESQALEVRSKVESGTDFGELAAQLSLDAYSKGKKGNLGWVTKDILVLQGQSAVLTDYAFGLDVGKLSQPILDEAKTKQLGYWVLKIIERQPEPAVDTHVQGIQVGSAELAKEIKARLQAGEDFAKLAGEFSNLDKAKEDGGDLRWVLPNIMGKSLDDFIFNTQNTPGTISDPIRDDKATTKGGYWLVKVSAQEDNRNIDNEQRQVLKNKAVSEWVLALTSDPSNKIENFLDGAKIAWAIARAAGSKS